MRTALLLTTLFAFTAPVLADECQPVKAADIIAAAQGRKDVVLKGARAVAFATEARALGVPMAEVPDYVFLDLSSPAYEAEWLEGATEKVAQACSWRAKPGSKFGEMMARWAKQA